MAETKDFDADDFIVSFDDMVRFMNAKFPNTACPHCGSDEGWIMETGNSPSESDEDNLTVYSMDYSAGELFRPYYAMHCDNCGSIRTLSADHVVSWIKSNPETPE